MQDVGSVSLLFFVAVVVGVAASPTAQGPVPNPNRAVHPSIAPAAPGVVVRPSPLLAGNDGLWNHGEGFDGATSADFAGWHGVDDGTGVDILDVHVDPAVVWAPFTWSSDIYPGLHPMLRLEGYLRPAGLLLPTSHPLYGPLGNAANTSPPVPQTYVDQGAFELFKPTTPRQPGQKILICMLVRSTFVFPRNNDGRSLGWQLYPGFFSPDGLERDEPLGQPRTAATFLGNNDDSLGAVIRPALNLLASWTQVPSADYWPVLAYPVLSVGGRQTTLNEQRYMQLLQATKLLLMDPSPKNPLYPSAVLTQPQIDNEVVCCFVGGSNGGHQSHWASLRYPHLIHGAYCEVINPSIQRLYGEHDLGHALSRLTGGPLAGATVTEADFLTWNQYVWSQGIETHDMSLPHLHAQGKTYRPITFTVGDEDITSTGTDWSRLLSGGSWMPSGLVNGTSPLGSPSAHRVGWMIAENSCHVYSPGPVTNPYTGVPNIYLSNDIAHAVFADAVDQQVAQGSAQPPVPALTHNARTPLQQLRGLDDPQEWWLGRAGEALPSPMTNDPLLRDDAFFTAVQPDSAGANPGRREAMLIRNNHLYVGSADGVVSKFRVDPDPSHKQRLERVAQCRRLGHESYAMTMTSAGKLIVGTRRHLHELDAGTLTVLRTTQLPWEVAQPHHMTVANLFGSEQILFASVHGGLVFCDLNLNPLHEWPEPGIRDFKVNGNAVTILSWRGVLATVTFDSSYNPTLIAVSNPIPAQLRLNGVGIEPPSQGAGFDLELMRVDWGAYGYNTAAISLWSADTDGAAVRAHWLSTLAGLPFLSATNPGHASGGQATPDESWIDIATCTQALPPSGDATISDHCLVLTGSGTLMLFNQFAQKVAQKSLTQTAQLGGYPFGVGAHTLVVGDLVPGTTGAYGEEIVIATNTGLMWMHVNDLLGSGNTLAATPPSGSGPWASGYWIDTTKAVGAVPDTHVQPRTNVSLSAAWAMARKTGPIGDDSLHVLDQRGVYWRVEYDGRVRLWERGGPPGIRTWGFVDWLSGAGTLFSPQNERLVVVPGLIATFPWCPKDTDLVLFENTPDYVHNNWSKRGQPNLLFESFLTNPLGGCLVAKSTGIEAWYWSSNSGTAAGEKPWANLVEGLHIAHPSGVVDGIWASTGEPPTVTPQGDGDRCPYHALRSHAPANAAMNQQAVRAVDLQMGAFAGKTAVVLGCPGGRVRVVLPGPMRPNDTTPHGLGSFASSADLGFGGSALAVRHEVGVSSETVRIWFGTICDPPRRPSAYANPQGALGDLDVATGAVHMMTWTPGSGFSTVLQSFAFPPSTQRGASGVVGLCVADLLPQHAGDELVVGTLSGDLIFFHIDPVSSQMTEVWRTHVDGSVGCYNSILAEDLNMDGRKELYVAGSMGLWRFVQPMEAP